jgi:hypothetical protein
MVSAGYQSLQDLISLPTGRKEDKIPEKREERIPHTSASSFVPLNTPRMSLILIWITQTHSETQGVNEPFRPLTKEKVTCMVVFLLVCVLNSTNLHDN